MIENYKDSKQQIEQIERLIKRQGRFSLICGLLFALIATIIIGIFYWFVGL